MDLPSSSTSAPPALSSKEKRGLHWGRFLRPKGFPTEQKSTKEPAAVRPTRNAPKKLWEEEDIRVLHRLWKRTARISPNMKGNSQKGPDLAKFLSTEHASGSPVSGESAKTGYLSQSSDHTSSSPELDCNRRQNGDRMRRKKGGSMKAGGPCYVCWATESPAWRKGRVFCDDNTPGLFPGETLCNSHGTLDRRGHLPSLVDCQGLLAEHQSTLAEHDKAAACAHFYTEPRAASRSISSQGQAANSPSRSTNSGQEASPSGAASLKVVARSPVRGDSSEMEAGPSAGAIVSNSPNHVQLSDGNVSHAVSAAAAVKKGVADHDAYAKMMARLPIALQSEARFDCFLKAAGLLADSSALPANGIPTAMNSNAERQGKKRRAEAADNDSCSLRDHKQCDEPATPAGKRLCLSTLAAEDAAAPISQGQTTQEMGQQMDLGRSKGRKKRQGRIKSNKALARMQEVEDMEVVARQQHLLSCAHAGSLNSNAGTAA